MIATGVVASLLVVTLAVTLLMPAWVTMHRLRRYRRAGLGVDHDTLHDELTTHFHLSTVDPPMPPHRNWWQGLG